MERNANLYNIDSATEREYYFDEGLGMSLDEHTRSLKQ